MSQQDITNHSTIKAAVEAFKRGYAPVPVRNGTKRPYGSAWTQLRFDSEEQVRASFQKYAEQDAGQIGLILGEASGGLIDVDLDHPKAMRLRDHFLPYSPMQTGRNGRPRSHRWFLVDPEDIPPTRQYKMPDGSMAVELRSNGAQTVIPPSTWHPSGWDGSPETTEKYQWHGTPWGGRAGPLKVEGRKLSIQVALLGLGAVLLDGWPMSGSRHETYLALAGGLLRHGESVHPYWERNLPTLIRALADVTNDDDGGEARVAEVMGTTIRRLSERKKSTGFTTLAELIGNDHAEQARRLAREVESLAGFVGHEPTRMGEQFAPEREKVIVLDEEAIPSTLPPPLAERNPMAERISTWAAVDLEPYLAGEVALPEPNVLTRTDGKSLFYSGGVNLLFGLSESAKTWVALLAGVQEIGKGERVMYVDFEDAPMTAIGRLRLLGVGDDDLRHQFRYVHPEEPMSDMQRYRFGEQVTEKGLRSHTVFQQLLEDFDPTLVILDGMTMLFGLHGHDTNEATGTDIVTTWLKKICRGGRTTVIAIDHTGKQAGAGASPIGAHHKIAMVQGTAIRADAVDRPMIGEKGLIRLMVYKDRHGVVRSHSIKSGGTEQHGGNFILDSTNSDHSLAFVEPPDSGDVVIGATAEHEKRLEELALAQEVQDKVLALFEGDESMYWTTTEVMEELQLERGVVYAAWEGLEALGEVVREGSTRWTKFRLRREGE